MTTQTRTQHLKEIEFQTQMLNNLKKMDSQSHCSIFYRNHTCVLGIKVPKVKCHLQYLV